MKLSLIQICKDEVENLKKTYPTFKDYIDEWIVVIPPGDKAKTFLKGKATVIEQDFTQPIEPEIIKQMAEWGLDVDEDYRLFKFADARNASLKAATGDYIIWWDGDDTPIGLENVKKFVEANPGCDVFNAVYDYYRDEEGNSISDHVRERVVINNGKFTWKGAELGLIHETMLPDGNFNYYQMDFPLDVFRIEHSTDAIDESSMRNHIALLYEYLKTNGKDPRTTFYLGIEYFNRKMFDYCVKVLLEYVKVGGSVEDRFNAWLKIGEAYAMLKDPHSSRNAFLEAQKELPNRPDSYLSIGESYYQAEEYVKAIEYLLTGLKKQLPQTKHVVDEVKYTFRPAVYLALSYMQVGKQEDAYEWFLRAYKLNPKHPWVKEHAKLFMEIKDLNDFVKGFVAVGQIAQRRYPKILPKLAESIPDELKGQELLMEFKWRYATPKIWPENSVVFFCSSAFEEWGPESLVKGTGGSEEAIIHLSKRLVDLGWDVTVYNNCIKEGIIDGVKWVRYERFNPRDMFNIFVAWRNNMQDAKTAVKKYIDLHDVPFEGQLTDENTAGLKIMVKSKYHQSVVPGVPEDRFGVVPNGVDWGQFAATPKKVPKSLIWTSSYDRGLYFLLQMWPDIRKEVPDATLDIYYGFSLYDTTPWGRTKEGQEWKRQMLQLMQQDGVTEHGRVGSDEIAQAYLKADIFAYPTDFPEISCISTMKAQMAGCRVLTTGYAALAETVVEPEEKLDIHNAQDFEKYKNKLIELLKTPRDEKALQRVSKEATARYSWDVVAKAWDTEFKK